MHRLWRSIEEHVALRASPDKTIRESVPILLVEHNLHGNDMLLGEVGDLIGDDRYQGTLE